jgi:formate hydrogenlyase transcriptional activator
MAGPHVLLVVDDEPAIIRSVQDLLRPEYRVIGAASAEEALALLSRKDVHLLLTDQRMPDMSGVELLRRAHKAHPDVVAMLFTAYADLRTLIEAVNQGHIFRYIPKPWEPEELRAAVRQAAEHYEARTEHGRLLLDLTRERDRLCLLLEINSAVAAHLDLHPLLAAIAGCLRQVLQHDYTSLALYDAATHGLRLHALDFATGRGLIQEGILVPMADAPAGQAFTHRQPVRYNAEELGRYHGEFARFLLAEGVQSLCCVPLISAKGILGTLNAASRRPDAFSADDAELLEQIAHPIAGAVANALAYQEIASLKNKLAEEKLYLEEEIRTEHNFEEIVGESAVLHRVLDQVAIVAPTDSAVLILGETGTGKELIARAIHNRSGRRDRTFVKVNCAALPTGLLESELFGHEKGAFTGAIAQKIGRFELAHRGTLFLDEIGDIPLELQPKLLRVLQEHEFERLGSTRTLRVDVRLVAATNRDLAQMVAERQFRSDLYYRLNVFPLSLPPLRDRREDIPLLVQYFTQKSGRRMGKRIETIPAETMNALVRYPWPGNIRELENFIERAVILSRGTTLQAPLVELKVPGASTPAAADTPAAPVRTGTLEEAEREHILSALRAANWKVGGAKGAAARLGISRTTLNSKMRKLGISRPG